MEEMLQKIIDNTNNKLKPHEMKEVKFKQILDVDPSLFIMPPLHIKLELVNWAFIKSDGYIYFPWSQKWIENIPDAEIIAWNIYQLSYFEDWGP